jgi:hypothetical protein
MVVKVSKPEINVREKISELDKPSGVAGEAMLRAETPQEQFNLIGAGRRNFLYNGAMQVWQRGTSFSNVGAGGAAAYTVDRWNATRYASNDNDITREDATDLDGFRYCARSARSGGDTTTTARFFHQVLEQRDSWALGGNWVTFSFYARAGSGFNGGQINSSLVYHTDPTKEERLYYNNFISASGTGNAESHVLDRSGPWKRFTNTAYIPANVQQVAVSVYTEQNLPAAVSADYFEITGCQVEIGKVATPFEHRSYGEELALCQRYYYRIDSADNNAFYQRFCVVNIESATQAEGFFQHPVRMRAIPTLGFSAASDFHIFTANSIKSVSNLLIDQSSPTAAGVAITATGMTGGNVGLLDADNTQNAWIEFKAEL